MTTPSLPDLRGQLESIDACLRKYVRLRAQLIEVIAFMEDDKEQEHLRAIKERSRNGAPETEAHEAIRPSTNGFKPKTFSSASEEQAPRRPAHNPLATTLSMEA